MDAYPPDIFDRLARLIGEDRLEFLAALKHHSIWAEVREAAINDALDLGKVVTKSDHDDAIADLQDKIKKAPDFHVDADRLHDAICEGRRQDAIDILNDITDCGLRSVREQHNLFPGRVSE